RFGQGLVGGIVGQILFAGEEPDQGPALVRAVVADRAAQLWILRLDGVDDRSLGHDAGDIDSDLALADAGERSKMLWQADDDHDRFNCGFWVANLGTQNQKSAIQNPKFTSTTALHPTTPLADRGRSEPSCRRRPASNRPARRWCRNRR